MKCDIMSLESLSCELAKVEPHARVTFYAGTQRGDNERSFKGARPMSNRICT